MEALIIALVAALASLLTFFSGFGLGTILTPFFMLFFPLPVAIALTGVVHLLNNLFKILLTVKYAHPATVFKFGLPSVLGAFAGASLLSHISSNDWSYNYVLFNMNCSVTIVKLTIAAVMLLFTLAELISAVKSFKAGPRMLFGGGLLSGFFGGLSGHQGALRSMFLVKTELSKEAFIATGIVIAVLVDLTRIPLYFSAEKIHHLSDNIFLIAVAVLSAFAGAYAGSKLLKKITMRTVQTVVSVTLFALSLLLGFGFI